MWIRIRIPNTDPDPGSYWIRIRIHNTGLKLAVFYCSSEENSGLFLLSAWRTFLLVLSKVTTHILFYVVKIFMIPHGGRPVSVSASGQGQTQYCTYLCMKGGGGKELAPPVLKKDIVVRSQFWGSRSELITQNSIRPLVFTKRLLRYQKVKEI